MKSNEKAKVSAEIVFDKCYLPLSLPYVGTVKYSCPVKRYFTIARILQIYCHYSAMLLFLQNTVSKIFHNSLDVENSRSL